MRAAWDSTDTLVTLALIAGKIGEEPSFNGAVNAANQLLMLWQPWKPLRRNSSVKSLKLLRAAHLRACYLTPNLAQCPEDELATASNRSM